MNYDQIFKLRLTEEERKMLADKSEKAGLNQSEFIRTMLAATSPEDMAVCRKELQNKALALNGIRSEIRRIGVNLNQIAHNANSDFFVWEDRLTLRRMDRLLARLLQEVERGYNNDGQHHG